MGGKASELGAGFYPEGRPGVLGRLSTKHWHFNEGNEISSVFNEEA